MEYGFEKIISLYMRCEQPEAGDHVLSCISLVSGKRCVSTFFMSVFDFILLVSAQMPMYSVDGREH